MSGTTDIVRERRHCNHTGVHMTRPLQHGQHGRPSTDDTISCALKKLRHPEGGSPDGRKHLRVNMEKIHQNGGIGSQVFYGGCEHVQEPGDEQEHAMVAPATDGHYW